ncbi:MAG: hypothetical protein H7175_03160 [Burkholderiales bacterium]|nr:hypothetical protein [Anaerolineae bacterium]
MLAANWALGYDKLCEPTSKGMIVRDVRFYPLLILGIVAIFAAAWLLKREAYPVTHVPMFSGRSTRGAVEYTRHFERYADGSEQAARPEHDLAVFKYTRYRPAISSCFDESLVRCELILGVMARAAQANGRDVSVYVLERWLWDFSEEPCCGHLIRTLEFPVADLSQDANLE